MLIIEVFNVGKSNRDFIRIASQPFVYEKFYAGDNSFYATNGFFLHSSSSPEITENGLYVRGRYPINDNKVMAVPNRKWLDKLAGAVREYNNWLEDTGGEAKPVSRTIIKKSPNLEFLGAILDLGEVIR